MNKKHHCQIYDEDASFGYFGTGNQIWYFDKETKMPACILSNGIEQFSHLSGEKFRIYGPTTMDSIGQEYYNGLMDK